MISSVEEVSTERDYDAFLLAKSDCARESGLDLAWVPSSHPLHDFQTELVRWSLRLGRAALFEDCGLGKTPQQLTWAENIIRATNRPVLILTPLAVGSQTIREADKFGIPASRWREGAALDARIWVVNYEKLHKVDPTNFAGIVADESSILKNFNGVRREAVTEALRRVPYRLLCTATAAPNDYIELGTSSEALGELGHMDMLTRYFINDQNSNHPNRLLSGAHWRFRGHAAVPFWKWVATWARALRRPSDLGFPDGPWVLPPLSEHYHVVRAATLPPGQLFERAATTMTEEREERRRTIRERCEKAAELVADSQRPAVIWCHLNTEGDLLEEILSSEAVQVSGDDSDEAKEEAFEDFSSGAVRVLITKPKIGAWGLNWQHCAHVVTFASHSFEQQYQTVRRCWRFGQKYPVVVDVILSEGERRVLANLRRKAQASDEMFQRIVQFMRSAMSSQERAQRREMEVPSWLS